MDQKQRNRVALVLAVILTPVLIYLLATTVFRGSKQPAPPPVPAPVAAAPLVAATPAAPPPLPPAAVEAALDPKIAAEQQQVAARLPRRNPFSAAPQSVGSVVRPRPAANPVPASETAIRLTGILSRPGSKRMAMINGKLFSEGDRLDPWTILKVDAREVILSDGDRQMVLKVK